MRHLFAFEQHVGLRVPGQSSTGEYRVKPDGRSLVSISHTGLTSAASIEQWRAYWKTCLGEF